jgi:hypothetical protein
MLFLKLIAQIIVLGTTLSFFEYHHAEYPLYSCFLVSTIVIWIAKDYLK